jgi:hypothetical protein
MRGERVARWNGSGCGRRTGYAAPIGRHTRAPIVLYSPEWMFVPPQDAPEGNAAPARLHENVASGTRPKMEVCRARTFPQPDQTATMTLRPAVAGVARSRSARC